MRIGWPPLPEQDERQAPPHRRDPRVFQPDRFEDLQQLGSRRTFIPSPVRCDHRQQRFSRRVAAACRERRSGVGQLGGHVRWIGFRCQPQRGQFAVLRLVPGQFQRGLATAAVDVKWPLVGQFAGGTQVLTPRFQVVASPHLRNLAVPNEDARAIDLEDSNLFALNRFPGYDRVEDGVRFTYGLDWQFDRPGWRIASTIGQTYRVSSRPTLLPDGTGLSSRVSDVVGRTEVRFRDFVKLTHRFRLDKDNFAVRRNEFDATIGNERTYAEIGYLRLNRDIGAGIEDLADREELRVAGRVAFARYWSLFGSGVFNLTSKNEDPLTTTDGFQPLRTRIGVAYQDECLELALTWRRDFVATGDAQKGNTFQINFALRNLGFR